jgi:hypothetical protein
VLPNLGLKLPGGPRIAALVVCLAAPGAAGAQTGTSRHSTLSPVQWQWTNRDHMTHVVILIFEQSTGRLRQASIVYGGVAPCGAEAPIADSIFLLRAEQFLRGVGWDSWYPGQQSVTAVGSEFVRVSAWAGDPSAFVVFHRLGGLVYAGTQMWMGHGGRYYPSGTIDPWNLRVTPGLAPRPDSSWLGGGFSDSLLTAARRLNVTRALAERPYYLTAFLHNKEGQPFLSDADWVLLLTRRGRCS